MPSSLSSQDQFVALSAFRYRLRRFLRFSEDAARRAGLTVLQYQLLLHIAGCPGREWATVGELAELLQAKPNGVVALVSRCEELGFVRRRPGRQDRRQVEIHLLAKGRRYLAKLAAQHQEPLLLLAEALEHASGEIQPPVRRKQGGPGLRPDGAADAGPAAGGPGSALIPARSYSRAGRTGRLK
jgi:DNA-binding MarR family transcriptional regulator